VSTPKQRSGPIWLVGMMGSGKSSVGPVLARRLGLPFVDNDARIEAQAGRSVAEIFAGEGEAGFRVREARAVAEAAGERAVVALGGGAIAQPGAAERLARAGTVVYLKASADELARRVGRAGGRPLLSGLSPEARRARLEQMLVEREPSYRSARIEVETTGRTLEEVAREIVRGLEAIVSAAETGSETPEREVASTSTRVVNVFLGDRSYPVRIGSDGFGGFGEEVARRTRANQVALVTVPAIGRRYAAPVMRSLRAAGLRVRRIDVPDGDRAKSLRELARLYDAFLAQGLDRKSALVALGGGAVGDLVGFAAATYLRGIPFVQVPTTILSMVDASIGGKTAVNLPQGKNLIGAFHQPSLVWIDTGTLRSLPVRERAAGMAEVVKAGAIWDEAWFATLEEECDRAMALEPEVLVPMLERACEIKAEVVSRDEREESGLRALLNFGHTIAHAIEAQARYRGILHGEAVSIGMVHAARLSEQLGLAPAGTHARLERLLERLGLPLEIPRPDRKAQLAAIQVDKKKEGRKLHYVVLRRIGQAETRELSPAEILSLENVKSAKNVKNKTSTVKKARRRA
jgi:3-dehydroquinate synthase